MPTLRTWFFLPVVFLCSCTQNKKPRQHSFYYWKTTANERAISAGDVSKLGVDHFYLHYFDVDWSEALQAPVPVGDAVSVYNLPLNVRRYTPVVFITNRTFERISPEDCDTLAAQITRKVNAKTEQVRHGAAISYICARYSFTADQAERYTLPNDTLKTIYQADELQIDCDWTAGTRDRYFRFLGKIKQLNPGKTISVTIRLYPYKYRSKMGIPPADKGTLMCYNLGGITDLSTKNSVFDLASLRQYLGNKKYPLPLDIALPVFGWYVWFREGKFKGIMHNDGDIAAYGDAVQKLGAGWQITTDTVLDDCYYREGDELRPELPDENELRQAAALLTQNIPQYEGITFFDWSENSTKKYEQVIREIFNRY